MQFKPEKLKKLSQGSFKIVHSLIDRKQVISEYLPDQESKVSTTLAIDYYLTKILAALIPGMPNAWHAQREIASNDNKPQIKNKAPYLIKDLIPTDQKHQKLNEIGEEINKLQFKETPTPQDQKK